MTTIIHTSNETYTLHHDAPEALSDLADCYGINGADIIAIEEYAA